MHLKIPFPQTVQKAISQKYLTKYIVSEEINLPINIFKLVLESMIVVVVPEVLHYICVDIFDLYFLKFSLLCPFNWFTRFKRVLICINKYICIVCIVLNNRWTSIAYTLFEFCNLKMMCGETRNQKNRNNFVKEEQVGWLPHFKINSKVRVVKTCGIVVMLDIQINGEYRNRLTHIW